MQKVVVIKGGHAEVQIENEYIKGRKKQILRVTLSFDLNFGTP